MSWLSSSLRYALSAVLTLGAACSDPTYTTTEDGGGDTGPSPADQVEDAAIIRDSRAVADAAEPPEVFPLGQYAVLARFYGTSTTRGGGWFAEEMTVLADVRRTGDGLQMTWKTCAYNGRAFVPLFPQIDYAGLDAEKFPVRTMQLVIDDNTFQTIGEPSLIGYQDVTGCPPGGMQSHPDRPWLVRGKCDCPSSALLPTMPSDCRVIDSDGDGEPGFTVQWKGGTENFSHSRVRDSSQLLNGVIAADGHHDAQLGADFDNHQLSCDREPCSRSTVRVCPAAQNPVRFWPLEAKDWTCAEVVGAVDNSNKLGLGPINAPGC